MLHNLKDIFSQTDRTDIRYTHYHQHMLKPIRFDKCLVGYDDHNTQRVDKKKKLKN